MSFRRALAAIAGLGLVLRVVYAYAIVGDDPLLGDAQQFQSFANNNADGRFFVQDRLLADEGVERPTADKPPLYPLLLTVVSLLGGRTWAWHHAVGIACGTATVVVVALLARRVAGPRVGLVAGALAAVSPLLIATDGSLRSESPYALLIALVLLCAVRLREAPAARAAAVFGAVVGLAALTRGEALLLLALLGLPLVRRVGWARLGVATAATVVVLAPWLVRSLVVFDQPVLISTNVGGLIAGANCDQTYRGELMGQWVYDCLRPKEHDNEAQEAIHQRDEGLRYAREHAGRLPAVVGARLGRTFELYRPRQNAMLMRFFEGRDRRVAEASVAWWYALVLLAAGGAVLLRRRGGPVWVLVAPLVLVVFVTVVSYGWTRFRVAVEPGFVVLAAVALAAAWDRVRA